MFAQYFNVLKFIGIYLILVPMLLGGCLSLISRRNKQLIVNLWGTKAQIFLGGLGIIIHELSHSLVALLFGHRITKVQLLHFPNPADPGDNSLGSVDHQWNDRSFYQRVGNVFIGVAPIIGNVAALISLTNWLMPGLLSLFSSTAAPLNLTLGRSILWLFLVTNISIGGFDLSSADLKNSASGLLALFTAILAVSLIISLLAPTTFFTWLQPWLSQFYLALGISLVFALITLILLYLVSWHQ